MCVCGAELVGPIVSLLSCCNQRLPSAAVIRLNAPVELLLQVGAIAKREEALHPGKKGGQHKTLQSAGYEIVYTNKWEESRFASVE